jgi:hypothetical protein
MATNPPTEYKPARIPVQVGESTKSRESFGRTGPIDVATYAYAMKHTKAMVHEALLEVIENPSEDYAELS